jgi:general L-amino acid transport system substrate-binding protein
MKTHGQDMKFALAFLILCAVCMVGFPVVHAKPPGTKDLSPGSATLKKVEQKGHLRCGMDTAITGLQTYGGAGTSVGEVFGPGGVADTAQGINVALCRAIATAIFGDPTNHIQLRVIDFGSQFKTVSDGIVDVTMMGTTQTLRRDGSTLNEPKTDFAPVDFPRLYFLDLTQILTDQFPWTDPTDRQKVLDDLTADSFKDVKSICVLADSTQEGLFTDLGFKIHSSTDGAAMTRDYVNHACDAAAVDGSILAGIAQDASVFGRGGVLTAVVQNPFSVESTGPVVAENDSAWKDIVDWTIDAMIYADFKNFSLQDSQKPPPNPDVDDEVDRFLGRTTSASGFFLGEELKLDRFYAKNILEKVGTYQEVMRGNNFKPEIVGPNKTFDEGGIQVPHAYR